MDSSNANKERPPLKDTFPPALSTLLKECWQKKAKARPTFTSILPRINNILVDYTIKDPEGANFWKYFFQGEVSGFFYDFITFHRKKWLGSHLWLTSINTWAKSFRTIVREAQSSAHYKVNLLERRLSALSYSASNVYLALLVTKSEDDSEVVTIERFGQFLAWFGPLSKNALYSTTFLDRMKSVVLKPWFHGDITKGEAENALATWQQPGSYLVRVSRTDPFGSPFTISLLTDSRSVLHMRVFRAGDTFVTQAQINGQMVRLEATGSVEHLVWTVAQSMGLTTPCSGSRLQLILKQLNQSVGEYVDVR